MSLAEAIDRTPWIDTHEHLVEERRRVGPGPSHVSRVRERPTRRSVVSSMVVETVVGHAELARRGLETALEGLVRDDWLTPDEALALVPQLMRGNALEIFG